MSRLDELSKVAEYVEDDFYNDYVVQKKVDGTKYDLYYVNGRLQQPSDLTAEFPHKLREQFTGFITAVVSEDQLFALKSLNYGAPQKGWPTYMCDFLWLERQGFKVPEYKFYEKVEKDLKNPFGDNAEFSLFSNEKS